jgi:class 3 adenylate cyclase
LTHRRQEIADVKLTHHLVIFPARAGGGRDPAVRTILFTDIVGSTNEARGGEAGIALLDVLDTIVRDALAATEGREVKHNGDGIMASFVSAAAAIRCAVRIQSALAERHWKNRGSVEGKNRRCSRRARRAQHDLFGATVQLAARLCSHTQPEQILVSNVVAELCLGKGWAFRDLGDLSVQGFNRPIRVHAVEWPSI